MRTCACKYSTDVSYWRAVFELSMFICTTGQTKMACQLEWRLSRQVGAAAGADAETRAGAQPSHDSAHVRVRTMRVH